MVSRKKKSKIGPKGPRKKTERGQNKETPKLPAQGQKTSDRCKSDDGNQGYHHSRTRSRKSSSGISCAEPVRSLPMRKCRILSGKIAVSPYTPCDLNSSPDVLVTKATRGGVNSSMSRSAVTSPEVKTRSDQTNESDGTVLGDTPKKRARQNAKINHNCTEEVGDPTHRVVVTRRNSSPERSGGRSNSVKKLVRHTPFTVAVNTDVSPIKSDGMETSEEDVSSERSDSLNTYGGRVSVTRTELSLSLPAGGSVCGANVGKREAPSVKVKLENDTVPLQQTVDILSDFSDDNLDSSKSDQVADRSNQISQAVKKKRLIRSFQEQETTDDRNNRLTQILKTRRRIRRPFQEHIPNLLEGNKCNSNSAEVTGTPSKIQVISLPRLDDKSDSHLGKVECIQRNNRQLCGYTSGITSGNVSSDGALCFSSGFIGNKCDRTPTVLLERCKIPPEVSGLSSAAKCGISCNSSSQLQALNSFEKPREVSSEASPEVLNFKKSSILTSTKSIQTRLDSTHSKAGYEKCRINDTQNVGIQIQVEVACKTTQTESLPKFQLPNFQEGSYVEESVEPLKDVNDLPRLMLALLEQFKSANKSSNRSFVIKGTGKSDSESVALQGEGTSSSLRGKEQKSAKLVKLNRSPNKQKDQMKTESNKFSSNKASRKESKSSVSDECKLKKNWSTSEGSDQKFVMSDRLSCASGSIKVKSKVSTFLKGLDSCKHGLTESECKIKQEGNTVNLVSESLVGDNRIGITNSKVIKSGSKGDPPKTSASVSKRRKSSSSESSKSSKGDETCVESDMLSNHKWNLSLGKDEKYGLGRDIRKRDDISQKTVGKTSNSTSCSREPSFVKCGRPGNISTASDNIPNIDVITYKERSAVTKKSNSLAVTVKNTKPEASISIAINGLKLQKSKYCRESSTRDGIRRKSGSDMPSVLQGESSNALETESITKKDESQVEKLENEQARQSKVFKTSCNSTACSIEPSSVECDSEESEHYSTLPKAAREGNVSVADHNIQIISVDTSALTKESKNMAVTLENTGSEVSHKESLVPEVAEKSSNSANDVICGSEDVQSPLSHSEEVVIKTEVDYSSSDDDNIDAISIYGEMEYDELLTGMCNYQDVKSPEDVSCVHKKSLHHNFESQDEMEESENKCVLDNIPSPLVQEDNMVTDSDIKDSNVKDEKCVEILELPEQNEGGFTIYNLVTDGGCPIVMDDSGVRATEVFAPELRNEDDVESTVSGSENVDSNNQGTSDDGSELPVEMYRVSSVTSLCCKSQALSPVEITVIDSTSGNEDEKKLPDNAMKPFGSPGNCVEQDMLIITPPRVVLGKHRRNNDVQDHPSPMDLKVALDNRYDPRTSIVFKRMCYTFLRKGCCNCVKFKHKFLPSLFVEMEKMESWKIFAILTYAIQRNFELFLEKFGIDAVNILSIRKEGNLFIYIAKHFSKRKLSVCEWKQLLNGIMHCGNCNDGSVKEVLKKLIYSYLHKNQVRETSDYNSMIDLVTKISCTLKSTKLLCEILKELKKGQFWFTKSTLEMMLQRCLTEASTPAGSQLTLIVGSLLCALNDISHADPYLLNLIMEFVNILRVNNNSLAEEIENMINGRRNSLSVQIDNNCNGASLSVISPGNETAVCLQGEQRVLHGEHGSESQGKRRVSLKRSSSQFLDIVPPSKKSVMSCSQHDSITSSSFSKANSGHSQYSVHTTDDCSVSQSECFVPEKPASVLTDCPVFGESLLSAKYPHNTDILASYHNSSEYKTSEEDFSIPTVVSGRALSPYVNRFPFLGKRPSLKNCTDSDSYLEVHPIVPAVDADVTSSKIVQGNQIQRNMKQFSPLKSLTDAEDEDLPLLSNHSSIPSSTQSCSSDITKSQVNASSEEKEEIRNCEKPDHLYNFQAQVDSTNIRTFPPIEFSGTDNISHNSAMLSLPSVHKEATAGVRELTLDEVVKKKQWSPALMLKLLVPCLNSPETEKQMLLKLLNIFDEDLEAAVPAVKALIDCMESRVFIELIDIATFRQLKKAVSTVVFNLILKMVISDIWTKAHHLLNLANDAGLPVIFSEALIDEEMSTSRKILVLCEICIRVDEMKEAIQYVRKGSLFCVRPIEWTYDSCEGDSEIRVALLVSLICKLVASGHSDLAPETYMAIFSFQNSLSEPLDLYSLANKVIVCALNGGANFLAYDVYSTLPDDVTSLPKVTMRALLCGMVSAEAKQFARHVYKKLTQVDMYPYFEAKELPTKIIIKSYWLKEEIFMVLDSALQIWEPILLEDDYRYKKQDLSISLLVKEYDLPEELDVLLKIDDEVTDEDPVPYYLTMRSNSSQAALEQVTDVLERMLNPPIKFDIVAAEDEAAERVVLNKVSLINHLISCAVHTTGYRSNL